MKITDKLTFFYTLEEKIWKDKIEANQYLGTISILLVALFGVIAGGGSAISDFLELGTEPSMRPIVATCVIIWGVNMGESIVAASHWAVALMRSLFLLVIMAVAWGLGYVASIAVIVAVSIILVLLFLVLLIKLILGLMTEKTYTVTDSFGNAKRDIFGKKVTAKGAEMDSTLRGSDGATYTRNSDGTVTKE